MASRTPVTTTLHVLCGSFPETTVKAVQQTVADYMVIGDARALRRGLRAAFSAVPETVRDSIIEAISTVLRYRPNAKRVWKSVWEHLHGTGTCEEVAHLYDVNVADLHMVLDEMSVATRDAVLVMPREEVRPNVDTQELNNLTQDLSKHVKRVGKRLRFISMYDPAIDPEDINQDLMVKALKTVYDYENIVPWEGTSYHDALLNKARASASSGVMDAIKYNANPSRARVVGVYACDSCSCTSAEKRKTCQWCGASMERATRVPQVTTVNNSTHATDHGRTYYVTPGETEGPQTQNLYVDLAGDLVEHLDPQAQQYLCCILRESKEFDAWLAEGQLDTSDDTSDSRVRKLAAIYVGEPRKRLDKKLKQAVRKARVR